MAALVAALFIQASDRSPALTALLGTRFGKPAQVIAGTALALAIGNVVAVIGGMLIADHLGPDARDLLLALALVSGGLSAFWPLKPPNRTSGRLGAFVTAAIGVAVLGLGDRTHFVTAALAARSDTPALAGIGAMIGALAVNITATVLGEAAWRALPIGAIRVVIGVLLVIVGAVQGLAAVRLI